MRQIGEQLGVSPQRAKSIVAKAERIVRFGKGGVYADYFAEWFD